MYLNKVIIVGRLTDNPELKTLPSGTPVCTFSVATNRVWIDKNTKEKKRETEYHNVVAWGVLAETAGRFLQKGSLVLVEGRLRTRKWENKEGQRLSRTEIVAQSLQLGPKTTGTQEETTKELSTEEIIPIVGEEDTTSQDMEEIPF